MLLRFNAYLRCRVGLYQSTFVRAPVACIYKSFASMSPAAKGPGGKRKTTDQQNDPKKKAKAGKDSGHSDALSFVNRAHYPAEMSNARCLQYNSNQIERPIETLNNALKETEQERSEIATKQAVIHWFKCDLRTTDNTALSKASEKAVADKVPLVGLYVVSPEDWEAHLTSPARVDFMLRSLEILRKSLDKLNIPLYISVVDERKMVVDQVLKVCNELDASHLFTNVEYEVDELRREASLTRKGLDAGVSVNVLPDTCVVHPGELESGSGNQYAVYSPWYRAWVKFLHSHDGHLKIHGAPKANSDKARKDLKAVFGHKVPEAPEGKRLSKEEAKKLASCWPAGEDEARARLDKFLSKMVGKYSEQRNYPAENATSMLSVHFAAGTLSARSAVVAAQGANSTVRLDGGNHGIIGWISEVAWRDFYRHVLVHWPFVCMNKPFKPEYTNIKWEYNEEHLAAWKTGHTGYPIVDAAMRQLNDTAYMHNRCRMIVSSFLSKDLLLDWRLGEQYFMSKLIDGDFASNNGGWGFGSSTGVDPQPYFRIFNPTLQSERFDKSGDYIRKWVPELKDLDSKAIHEPYARGGEKAAKSKGYPKPIVEHKFARERALSRYKEGLGRGTA